MIFANSAFVKFSSLIFLLPSFVCSINKCCSENQYFDKYVKCVDYLTVNDTKQSFRFYDDLKNHNIFTNLSSLPCDGDKFQLRHFDGYQVMENGSLLHKDQSVLFSENSYCVEMYNHDGLGLVKTVYSCPCIDHLCVWKCCTPGSELEINKTINGTTKIACRNTIDTNTKPWSIDQLNATDLPSFYVDRYKLQTCTDNIVNKFVLIIGARHEYSLQKNGSIVTDHFGVIEKYDYCGGFERNNGSARRVLIACVKEPVVEMKYIYYSVLNTIGSIFLLVTITLHTWLPELAGLHGKCLICHASCLLVAQTCNTINQVAVAYPSPNFACCFLAYLMQFSYLTAFFWLNVICVDMSLTFGNIRQLNRDELSRKYKKRFAVYSVYSWGGGVFMTCFTLLMEYGVGLPVGFLYKPNIGIQSCWFFKSSAIAIYFYGPMGVLLLVNLGLFIFTIRRIIMISRETSVLQQAGNVRHNSNSNSVVENKRLVIYLKIFSLMGICWLMEIISWLIAGQDEIWFLTDGVNCLRGFFIFIVFCWKSMVYKSILNKLPWLRQLLEFRLKSKTKQANGIETSGTISNTSTKTPESMESRKTEIDELEMEFHKDI